MSSTGQRRDPRESGLLRRDRRRLPAVPVLLRGHPERRRRGVHAPHQVFVPARMGDLRDVRGLWLPAERGDPAPFVGLRSARVRCRSLRQYDPAVERGGPLQRHGPVRRLPIGLRVWRSDRGRVGWRRRRWHPGLRRGEYLQPFSTELLLQNLVRDCH